ncbi:hypothetical protein AwWohl_05930 [Gammaproteobacteria bacterium]|nr:hypothetical protein AwWohl_05930 [Gammaproteobacteria bacterium]
MKPYNQAIILVLITNLLVTLPMATKAFAQTAILSTQNKAADIKWIKRGRALVEYPLCYQLWQCRSESSLQNQEKDVPVLPVGTWGLCENYLTIQGGAPKCLSCNALVPEADCF